VRAQIRNEEKNMVHTQICKTTLSPVLNGCGTVLLIKSVPIVALYPVEKWPEMYCPRRLVLPTPEEPTRTSLMVLGEEDEDVEDKEDMLTGR
jgi:hypothetical protein